ncbi:MAG TPA: efflux RND transporter periplasmic adaptor subunit [Longimicrobium sp.]
MTTMTMPRRLARPLAVPLLVLAAACGGDASAEVAPAADVVPVRTAPVVETEVTEPIRATGVLAAKEEAQLSFKIGGVISRIYVDEGQTVRAGQLLATLDPGEIDAQVARARTGADKAERDLARARALYDDSVATLEQVQNAASGAQAAQAELRIAAFNRRYARIVAPSAGTVLRRAADEGELASPGSAVLTLGSSGGGTVLRVGLADRDAVRVQRGAAARVTLDAFPGQTFNGTVSEVAAASSAGTGTYEVEVRVHAAGQALASGLIGRVEIAPAGARRLPTVPLEAVIEADGDSAIVFGLTADGKKARRIPVTVASIAGGRVAVTGLEGVGAVVTDGVAYLADGTAVRRIP